VRIPLELAPVRRPLDVLAVGENSLDLVAVLPTHPAPGAKLRMRQFSRQPGGQVATAAAALAALGWRTEYIGRFGDDDHGDAGLASLDEARVRRSRVVRCAGTRSRVALILVLEDTGERTVLWDQEPGLMLSPEDVPDEAVREARVLLLDDCGDAAIDLAARARRAGTRTLIDIEHVRPGLEALLAQIDIIIAAQGLPEALTGEADTGRALATLQRGTGAAVVCVTLEAEGSLARAGGVEIRTPGFPVPVVDTTGAGDLFRAGFVHGWLGPGDAAELEEVLRHANAVAALGCQGLGARGHLPTAPEVESFLRSRGSRT
jgi:sulfofructose kinase